MVRHVNIDNEADYDDGEDDGDWQPPPRQELQHQREAGSTAGGGDRSPREQEVEEIEENPFNDENTTLADMRRQMTRQMSPKNKEISQLNEKMIEMMDQMTAMMQRTAVVSVMPNPPTDPPNLQLPQVSGVRGTPEHGHEAQNVTRQPTPQNIASTSELVTVAQFKGIITEKIKAIIALERKYWKGKLTLSDNVLTHPKIESTRIVMSSSVPPVDERKHRKKPIQKEQWEAAVSKKTIKMLKQLEEVSGVKWKSPTEPVLDLKGLPKVQASISKQHPGQASSSKFGMIKSSKRKTKLKNLKEKKTTTQRVIDSLDEYYQTTRRPVKLVDFMSGLKMDEAEEADEEPLPVENCRRRRKNHTMMESTTMKKETKVFVTGEVAADGDI
ncbi:hypothetical protein M5K25_022283 [Dendrobium thyrsiflorum]|uniref:Uncharacterized protein n=1 Tax=Dendrobium thyrsiflorum TaxID=117978 RepID=A0ABD0U5Z5_DENTH